MYFKMDHFIVVGGTSGIGKAISENLNKQGLQVTTISRRAEGLTGIDHVSLDVIQSEISVERFEGDIKGMVYCPGTINLKPFRSLSIEDFREDWEINFLGAVKSLKTLLPKIKESRGSIVLFSTVAVQMGMPFHASIGSAKAAIEGLTKSLAAELAPNVRVNCIAPSLTETPLTERLLSTEERRKASADRHPIGRVGNPEDLAQMACFLLSEQSSWITGQIIGVDGGLSTLRV